MKLTARQKFARDRARYPRSAWFTTPALWAVATFRLGEWAEEHRGLRGVILRCLHGAVYLISQCLTGIEIPRGTQIGPGLRIHHRNVVINPASRIGADCVLLHGVTLGNRIPNGPAPLLGDRVQVGAYAQLLGGISIGDDARIGAMSVVVKDVPSGAIALGNPASIRVAE